MDIHNATYYDSNDILTLLTEAGVCTSLEHLFIGFFQPAWTKNRDGRSGPHIRVTAPKHSTATVRIGIVKREHLGISPLEQIAVADDAVALHIPKPIIGELLTKFRNYGNTLVWRSDIDIEFLALLHSVKIHRNIDRTTVRQSKDAALKARLDIALEKRERLEKTLQRLERSRETILDQIDDTEMLIQDLRARMEERVSRTP
jgi:hypothetical protein